MKRPGNIILFLLLFSCPVLAEDEVFLDLSLPEVPRYNTGSLRFENPAKDTYEEDENYLKPSFGTIKDMFDEDFGKPKTKNTEKNK